MRPFLSWLGFFKVPLRHNACIVEWPLPTAEDVVEACVCVCVCVCAALHTQSTLKTLHMLWTCSKTCDFSGQLNLA